MRESDRADEERQKHYGGKLQMRIFKRENDRTVKRRRARTTRKKDVKREQEKKKEREIKMYKLKIKLSSGHAIAL